MKISYCHRTQMWNMSCDFHSEEIKRYTLQLSSKLCVQNIYIHTETHNIIKDITTSHKAI